ncbi:winged helix-turn-helix domain-containing protein [Streptomyces inhibens]|uniref:winged helix-turn-helix domain-containing protein n=1 Tax=Streptomyces inhibens TaxID=2293571 RepID=UPI001FD5B83E|nr:winged helix-turn-helix domain-containing protein [Streptomyces inhibens]
MAPDHGDPDLIRSGPNNDIPEELPGAVQHGAIHGGIVVYRIHFTSHDLARTRPAEVPMPLSELSMAARVLQDRSQSRLLDTWRRRSRAQLSARARMALSLIPPVGWSPTFLTPAQAGGPEELLEQVRATPRKLIRAEMAVIAENQPVPAWARRLSDDAELREELYDGLGHLYTQLMSSHWTQIIGQFTADRTVRVRQFLNGGVERLLCQVNPQWVRWNPPVLEIRNRIEHDLHLEGQGIVLVPSLFATRSIVADDTHAQSQPTVTYPVAHDQPLRQLFLLTAKPTTSSSAVALSALLGNTRAAVLNAIAEHPGCSTKELAALTGIAPPSASEHATVLREAGLISTVRHRNTALHSPTSLGIVLLNTADSPSCWTSSTEPWK